MPDLVPHPIPHAGNEAIMARASEALDSLDSPLEYYRIGCGAQVWRLLCDPQEHYRTEEDTYDRFIRNGQFPVW